METGFKFKIDKRQKKENKQFILSALFIVYCLLSLNAAAQKQPKDSLNPKFTIDIQGYDPVLSESSKISSETPAKDTSTATPPKLDYSIQTKPFDTQYEAATIKSVKVLDNKLDKLYHGFLKAGLGNDGTYLGELFLNSTRSKNSETGIHLLHLSGDPALKDVGDGGFSDNKADLFGKLFLDHSVFTGTMGYTREVVHYYGFNTNDTLIPADQIKQLYNVFDLGLDYKSDYLTRAHLDHHFSIKYYNLSDMFNTSENDFAIDGVVGEDFSGKYGSLHMLLDYSKKMDSNNQQLLTINSNPSRNIFTLEPQIKLDQDNFHLTGGLNFTREYNYDAAYHLYPEVHLGLPIAENIISIYADVNGYVQKNSYRSFLEENPFINNIVNSLLNTSHKIVFKGGVTGNFSAATSFEAHFGYDAFNFMPFYINSSLTATNKFTIVYDNGSVMNIHAEFHHHPNEKFLFGLKADYYSYMMDNFQKAWQKPLNELTLTGGYNIDDKILASLDIYSNGNRYAYVAENQSTVTLKGFVDVSLKLEYRYTKILSVFLQLNNLGFSRYYIWNNYPSERLNVLGGLTYSFWGDKTK